MAKGFKIVHLKPKDSVKAHPPYDVWALQIATFGTRVTAMVRPVGFHICPAAW